MTRKLFLLTLITYSISTFAISASDINQRLGRGINMGNMLEAEVEGGWGVVVKEHYFDSIAQKGFNSVRIPIRWSTPERADTTAPYTINPAFFNRVDSVIEFARNAHLNIVINMHHYNELFQNSTGTHRDRFLALWRQIADHYKAYPDSLIFEVLNEPNTDLTAERWNVLFTEALQIIRETNPARTVIVGIAEWGGIGGLSKLNLPADSNLILTVHYYNPFQFTHQGAEWSEGMDQYLGTTWNASFIQKNTVINELEAVREFSSSHNIPVYVGEFGAYSKADLHSRVLWTSYCSRLFEKYNFSWAYWEFCAGFGAYDPVNERWRDSLVTALLSNDTTILEMKEDSIDGVDLVANGDFANGKTGWLFGVWDTTGKATGAVTNGEYVVTVTEKTASPWGIQLIYSDIPLIKGDTYTLQFDAYADSSASLGASVAMAVDPYTSYGDINVSLNTAKKTFGVQFTMKSNDPEGRITFNLGSNSRLIHIDNVKLLHQEKASSVKRDSRYSRPHFQPDLSISKGYIYLTNLKSMRSPVQVWLYTAQGRTLFQSSLTLTERDYIRIPAGNVSGTVFVKIRTDLKNYYRTVLITR